MVAADHDVVEHAHVAEQRQVLERAADAEAGTIVDGVPGKRLALVEKPALGRPGTPGRVVGQNQG